MRKNDGEQNYYLSSLALEILTICSNEHNLNKVYLKGLMIKLVNNLT